MRGAWGTGDSESGQRSETMALARAASFGPRQRRAAPNLTGTYFRALSSVPGSTALSRRQSRLVPAASQ